MSNLSWEDRIANLVLKASRRLHLLRELKRAGLSAKDLLTCYFSFVQSKTEYVCQVWSTALTSEQSHMVEDHAEPCRSSPPTRPLHEHMLVTLRQRCNEPCTTDFIKTVKPLMTSEHPEVIANTFSRSHLSHNKIILYHWRNSPICLG